MAGKKAKPIPRGMDRFAVTSGRDGFAVARAVRGSRPMAVLPTWATYTAGHYSDALSLSIEFAVPFPLAPLGAARILFPTSPTCGIIPPHTGHIGIRHPQMGRIQ